MSAALPALLAGAAAAVVVLRPAPPRRLAALAVRPHRPVPSPSPGSPRRPSTRPWAGPAGACVLGGLALALLVGGVPGVLLGVALAVLGPRLLSRLEPRDVREHRERLQADLPLALDLLAACLLGGASLPAAVRAVSEAVPGPCGAALARVGAALEVGSPPGEAWRPLAEGGDELASAAVRALARAGDGGAPVAAAIARLAGEARDAARVRGQEAAERAGVLAVAPLGLCFLPAFVLLGVVPVVAGLVGPLLAQF